MVGGMKPAVKAAIVCIVAAIALPYVMFAFIQWQVNPGLWSEGGRVAAMMLTALLLLCGFVLSPDMDRIGRTLFGDDE